MTDPHEALDESYSRLHTTGPEFDGWLSNHGPMAADALIRLGRTEAVEAWVGRYSRRLHHAPGPRWAIDESEWREVLGDPSRLGDWCAFFEERLTEEPWRDVLVRWWPRLIDGAIASATHGLIRTGHAVRALLETTTPARTVELAHALGYWAARHQRLPAHGRPAGALPPEDALSEVPSIGVSGGIRTRLGDLDHSAQWAPAVGRLRPLPGPEAVPAALDELVDAAVGHYAYWAHRNPVMLVHAATAPRAAALVLPALPTDLWAQTHDAAWAASASISAAYRPTGARPATPGRGGRLLTPERVTDMAVATDDEHAIKFVEVAQESHRRGNPAALAAGAQAAALIGTGR
ncbi:questin oxidase family protein [Nocardioides sp. AX2bis]|uniref:questin oxidase family protein n=1 Tax=Nocardioides sp. AX2bis TaxID=2653157 RepID=UPI001F266665|nr:questin oxidase family protein [Nocardioides sp. AX2bis]